MKKWALPVALATALVYMTLSVSAAACLFAHHSHTRTVHHHTGGSTHSSLCAWACQANQTVDLSPAAPQTKPLQLVTLLLLVGFSLPSLRLQQSTQPRAPPRQ